MNKVRIGIIGMGRMGMTHYSIINTHPAVEIVSVSDTSKITLDMLKKYIPTLNIFTDYKDLIKAGGIDGVIVCTPSALHYPVCKMAGENNIAVFCEKPFTTNQTQAEELASLFEKKGLVNQVGYVNRYNPVFLKVKEFIDKGVIGKLVHVKAEMYSSAITKPQTDKSWRSTRENGGGVTYEMAAHILDLLTMMIGAPEKVFGSMLVNVFSANVEDIVSTSLRYREGVSCSLFVDWSDASYRKPMIKLEFLGDKGKIMADFYGLKVFLAKEDKESGLGEGWTSIAKLSIPDNVPYYVRGNGFTHQLYQFADAILGKKDTSFCTFRDAALTQKTIHTIFDNHKEGK